MNRRLELHPSSLIPHPFFVFLLDALVAQHVIPQIFVRGNVAQALDAEVPAGAFVQISGSGFVLHLGVRQRELPLSYTKAVAFATALLNY